MCENYKIVGDWGSGGVGEWGSGGVGEWGLELGRRKRKEINTNLAWKKIKQAIGISSPRRKYNK